MAITQRQLEVWSNQGAMVQSKNTHELIRRVLKSDKSKIRDRNVDFFLQGSYRNSTNIRGNSDVDLVVMLKDTFFYNTEKLDIFEKFSIAESIPKPDYSFYEFKNDVIDTLNQYFGSGSIEIGNKSIILEASANRLVADIVVCCEYRDYKNFTKTSNEDYDSGIIFFTTEDDEEIVNFPKLHFDNGAVKNQRTGGKYKPVIRIFKNMKSLLKQKGIISDKFAPSYYIENLLYNVPDKLYEGDYGTILVNILNWFREADFDSFILQTKRKWLFGYDVDQWNKKNATQFLHKIIELWNGGV